MAPLTLIRTGIVLGNGGASVGVTKLWAVTCVDVCETLVPVLVQEQHPVATLTC